MSAFKSVIPLILILAATGGCGQQLVEFGNPTPTVVSTDPADAAAAVALDKAVTATFSEAMDPATLNGTTFTLKQGAAAVAGTVTSSGATATFTPSAALASSTFTATVSAGAKSAAHGIGLAAERSWSFTTVGATPAGPAVTSTDPGSNETNVARGKQLSATFSKAMDPATLSASTFTLKQGATAVPGSVSYTGTIATFTPTSILGSGLGFDARITTGAKDLSGVGLATDHAWSFSTGVVITVVPAVTVVDPGNGAIGVLINKQVGAAFNEPMSCATLAAAFTLKQGAAAVPGAVTCSGSSATFAPAGNLTPGAIYAATISTAAKDLAGNALAADYNWSFTTDNAAPPVITFINPSDAAIGVCPNEVVRATFNDAIDVRTLVPANFTLTSPTAPVGGLVSYDSQGHTASFTPTGNLQTNTAYVAKVTTGVKDEAGTPLAKDKVWRFTTGATLCQAPVNLKSLSTFVAVAGAGLTNSNSGGTTVLNGDVGLSPTATCLGDGSPCSAVDPVINGTFYANDPAGIAAAAKVDLTDAYNDGAGRPPGVTLNDLSGLTLTPGVYSSGSTMSIAVGGTLVLDAQGDSNGVWIFQVGSSLTVNNNAKVLLVNGAKASNVFWAIFASSTLGGNVSFKGSVLAGSSNSVGTGSTVEGRLLCRTGQITLLSNTITLPAQ